jgi:hypothetical protein
MWLESRDPSPRTPVSLENGHSIYSGGHFISYFNFAVAIGILITDSSFGLHKLPILTPACF